MLGFNTILNAQPKGNFLNYPSEYYFDASNLYDDNKLFLADIEVNKILKDTIFNSYSDKAFLLESDIFIKAGNFNVAKDKLLEFEKTRVNSPFLPFVNFKLAKIYFELEQYNYAFEYFSKSEINSIKFYEKTENSNHKYIDLAHLSSYWKAISKAYDKSYVDAFDDFTNVITLKEDGIYSDDALFSQAQIFEIKKEYEKAIDTYRSLRVKYPTSDNYLRSLIRESANHLTLRDVTKATASIERANTVWKNINEKDSIGLLLQSQIGLENSLEEILYLRGEISNLSGNFENALIFYNTFLETFNSSKLKYQVLLGKGFTLLNLSKETEALDCYNKIIKELDNDEYRTLSLAKLYRILTLKKLNRIDETEKEMISLSLNSSYPYIGLILLELGQLHYEREDMETSRRYLERGVKESFNTDTDIRTRLLLGATYLNLKLWDKSRDIYKESIDLAENADDRFLPLRNWYLNEARFKLGVAYVKADRTSLAIKPLSAFISEEKNTNRLAEGSFWLAEAYYNSGLLTNSIQTYSSIIDKYPSHIRREDCLYGLGWSYFRQKNFNKSTKTFNQLVSEYPKSKYAVEVLARQADGYYILKDYSNAAKLYNRVSKEYPKSDEAEYCSYQICHAYYRLGQYDNSINYLFEFVRKFNQSKLSANAMYLIAWIKFQQKKYDEAISNLEYLIEAYPNSDYLARSYYTIGDSYYNKRDYENAINSYKKVIDSYPTSSLAPESMKAVQNCLVLLGKEDEAIEIIDVYTGKNENSPFTYDFMSTKARLQFDNRRFNEAIDEYNKIIDKYPNNEENAEAIYWIARSYINMEEVVQAENAFIKLQNKYPKSEYAPQGMLQNALLQKNLSKPLKADSIFKNLENLYPESNSASQAGFERAIIYYTMGDTLKSIETYKEIYNKYNLNDYTLEAKYRVAMFYKNQNQLDSALYHFEFIKNQDLNKDFAAESHYRIGEIWKNKKNLDLAIKSYNEVKENYTSYEDWYSLSLLSLGEIYEELKDWNNAMENYKILQEIRLDDDFGKTAKSRIKRIEKFINK